MKFSDIEWAGFYTWCNSGTNNEYVNLLGDEDFIFRLRQNPAQVTYDEFYNKVISNFMNAWGRMFIQRNTGEEIYNLIIEVHSLFLTLKDMTLLDVNLNVGSSEFKTIETIYNKLTNIWGISMTGFSKLSHVMNDSLFVMIDNEIRRQFKKKYIVDNSASGYINWLRAMQEEAIEITRDFYAMGYFGSPAQYLSQKLTFTEVGCVKSLAKYIDEYNYNTITRKLTIPPTWVPKIGVIEDA